MLSCETCRDRMLEYLYDLLESDERQEWDAHMKDCPTCQAELVRAKAQQQLLAIAAKMTFPAVRFTSPAADVEIRNPKSEIRKKKILFGFRISDFGFPAKRLVAAAAVLLALGAAVPAIWYGRDYRRTEETIALATQRIEETNKERRQIDEQLARQPQQKEERIAAVYKALGESQLRMRVQGPASLRAARRRIIRSSRRTSTVSRSRRRCPWK